MEAAIATFGCCWAPITGQRQRGSVQRWRRWTVSGEMQLVIPSSLIAFVDQPHHLKNRLIFYRYLTICAVNLKFQEICISGSKFSARHALLFNCTEEAHRPVDCETVSKWIMKNSAESRNMNWILANSKPCPKCKRPIEKNQGCMHMTCNPPCKY